MKGLYFVYFVHLQPNINYSPQNLKLNCILIIDGMKTPCMYYSRNDQNLAYICLKISCSTYLRHSLPILVHTAAVIYLTIGSYKVMSDP